MTVSKIGEGIWQFNEAFKEGGPYVDAYLIVGEKEALLVDSLQTEAGLYEEVRKITNLPVSVVLTHGHGDHAGVSLKDLYENNCKIYMDLRDMSIVLKGFGEAIIEEEWIQGIEPGTIFDLGGFKLEAIPIPGHTPGSLVLLEREKQLLFSGDTIGSGYFWMQLSVSLPLNIFLKNLEYFWDQVSSMKDILVYPGHRNQSPVQLNLQYIKDVIDITKDIVTGEREGSDDAMSFMGTDIKFKRISHGLMRDYLYDPKKI